MPKYNFEEIKHSKGFVKAASGFQHSVFLDSDGILFGSGKCDKSQLGKNEGNSAIQFTSLRQLNINYNYIDGKIIDVACGRYHTCLLTDKGKVYSFGINRFGQLGINNSEIYVSNDPLEILFENGDFIVKISAGDFHSMYLTKEGKILANGSNTLGETNGVYEDIKYYSTPFQLDLQEEAVDILASNYRSTCKLKSGKHIFWGGFYYQPNYNSRNMPHIYGFNCFEEEKGLENKTIKSIGLGLYHDIVLVEETI